jgi:DNA-directed RNA polymerase specialized sigma subunit
VEVIQKAINKFQGDREELESIANLAYAIAIKNYKKKSKAAFDTYAYRCIRNAILDYMKGMKTQKRTPKVVHKKPEMMSPFWEIEEVLQVAINDKETVDIRRLPLSRRWL